MSTLAKFKILVDFYGGDKVDMVGISFDPPHIKLHRKEHLKALTELACEIIQDNIKGSKVDGKIQDLGQEDG